MAQPANELPVDNVKASEPNERTQAPVRREEERWDPLETLRQEVDRIFDDFHPLTWYRPARSPRVFGAWDRLQNWVLAPAIDMTETDSDYRISAELPGMESSDISIKLSNGMLSLSGEKREETKVDPKAGYVINERRFGSFRRSFRLPEDVNQDTITANFANGLLTLTLPKSEESKAQEKTIEIRNA